MNDNFRKDPDDDLMMPYHKLPRNMVATIGWLLYKFAKEPDTEHLKTLSLHVSIELEKILPSTQEEMDKLITSYMEENSGKK